MTPPLLLPALLLVLGVLLVGRVLYDRLEMRPVSEDEAQEFTRAMREIEEKREAA